MPPTQQPTPAPTGIHDRDTCLASSTSLTTSAATDPSSLPLLDAVSLPVPDLAPGQPACLSEPPAQSSSTMAPGSSTTTELPLAPAPPHTRSHAGITKPKIYSDGTVRYAYTASGEPYMVKEALPSPSWKATMIDEYNALMRNKTWTLVPPASGHNVINCKWVFNLKYKADESMDHHNARLIVKGFKQRLSINYDDTLSPVVNPTTIRLILSLDVTHGWVIRQLDVQNVFFSH
jgi:hypothetical protein